ncbi:glucagon-like peptide 1 receptor, partial [Pelobates cultripes]
MWISRATLALGLFCTLISDYAGLREIPALFEGRLKVVISFYMNSVTFNSSILMNTNTVSTKCWTRNYNMNYWLIIRLPILIAIGVNFVIFIRVICIIISKLQANLMCRTDTKCRLAKSTLTLIPLLGTHEIIFAFITDEHAKGIIRYIKLFFELSFSSFQGLMVAVLYCFINNE